MPSDNGKAGTTRDDKSYVRPGYDVEDVARYVLQASGNAGRPASNLRLQRLLYFVDGYYMAVHQGSDLFAEDFLAWRYGPAVRQAYTLFMRNGADKIPERDYATKTTVWFDDESRKVMVDPVAWEPRMIEDDDQAFISNVVRLLARYDDIDLVEVSRDPKGPWKRHCDGDPSSVIATISKAVRKSPRPAKDPGPTGQKVANHGVRDATEPVAGSSSPPISPRPCMETFPSASGGDMLYCPLGIHKRLHKHCFYFPKENKKCRLREQSSLAVIGWTSLWRATTSRRRAMLGKALLTSNSFGIPKSTGSISMG